MLCAARVFYVFTNATRDLSLYYDIKLKKPLAIQTTGGAMIPTTTPCEQEPNLCSTPPKFLWPFCVQNQQHATYNGTVRYGKECKILEHSWWLQLSKRQRLKFLPGW